MITAKSGFWYRHKEIKNNKIYISEHIKETENKEEIKKFIKNLFLKK